jgi:hypothetical protein
MKSYPMRHPRRNRGFAISATKVRRFFETLLTGVAAAFITPFIDGGAANEQRLRSLLRLLTEG